MGTVFFLDFFFLLRSNLTVYSKLALNSQFPCLNLSNAKIMGVPHHLAQVVILNDDDNKESKEWL